MAGEVGPASVACIVLAAGAGRRFGATKQLAPLGDQTVLETVLANVWAVPALDPVVCVLGAHADAIRSAIDFEGVEVVVAADWADGQSASLRAGVAGALGDRAWNRGAQRPTIARSRDDRAVLIVLGDQPGITPQVLAGVLARYDPARHDAVRLTYDGVPGNPVLLGPPLLARVPELVGDHGARELLQTARVRHWEAGHLCDPTDIDTPEDLEAFTHEA